MIKLFKGTMTCDECNKPFETMLPNDPQYDDPMHFCNRCRLLMHLQSPFIEDSALEMYKFERKESVHDTFPQFRNEHMLDRCYIYDVTVDDHEEIGSQTFALVVYESEAPHDTLSYVCEGNADSILTHINAVKESIEQYNQYMEEI